MHVVAIFAYLAIIIMNVLYYAIPLRDLRAYEILTMCNLAVYSVCTVMFGVIVS
jgi:hypothetical protein